MTTIPSMSEDVATRIAKISGTVVGHDGKGGSGTCVRFEDGKVGLLTAKHVVIECIRNTGGIKIAIPTSGIDFHLPQQIRMDSSQQGDAAYIISDKLTSLPAIPFEEWTSNQTCISPEVKVIAFGFPAEFKKVMSGKINLKLAFLGDKIMSAQGNTLTCSIDETVSGIPKSLTGMSGGGLFTETGTFLGIVISERRNVTPTKGELDVLLPSSYQELYKPFSMPSNGPGPGFLAEDITVAVNLQDTQGKLIATIGVNAQTYWSTTNPEAEFGRIGRLLTLEIIIPGIQTHYPINIESMFYNWDDDSPEARRKAVQEEFKFLLLRMGWLFSEQDDTLKITPMI